MGNGGLWGFHVHLELCLFLGSPKLMLCSQCLDQSFPGCGLRGLVCAGGGMFMALETRKGSLKRSEEVPQVQG